MSRIVITGKLTGLEKVLRPLLLLSKPAQVTAVTRRAVDKASQPMAKEAKQLVSRDTGLMKLAIGRKVMVYRRTGTVVVIIGPRTGYQKNKKGVKRETALGRRLAASAVGKSRITSSGRKLVARPRRPVYYAHLLEYGRAPVRVKRARLLFGNLTSVRQPIRVWGTSVRAARPRPFLRPAFQRHKRGAVVIIGSVVKAGVTRVLKGGRP